MKVLHFLPVYLPAWQFGGPIMSVSRLCEGLVQEGADVRVITTNAGLPDFPQDQLGIPQTVNGVQVIYYAVDHQKGVIQSRALVKDLPDHMNWADILHLSSIWQPLGIPVQQAAHLAGVPVIQTLRGALGPYSLRRGWWKKVPYFFAKERRLLQRAAALHCTTALEAREISWLGLKPPVKLLPNPLELSQLECSPHLGAQWRQMMGFSFSDQLLLVIGRFHHKKGLEMIPNVLQGIAHRPWKILFIGNDEDGTGLRLRIELKRLGLNDRCHWLDHLPSDQLLGPYNAADLLLLPSRHENFGNVVVEALACGCGTLISDRVGVGDDIRDCPGVTISPRTEEQWITALLQLLSSSRPGHLSAQWIGKYFSQSLVTSQAMKMYLSILTHD